MKFLFLFSVLVILKINQGYTKRVVCYHTNWSTYRPGDGKFTVNDIDPNLCTHIIYSFARVQGNGLASTEPTDPEMYKQVIALKAQNPDLKVLLAVGGWNHPAATFTQMVSTQQSRAEFVENSYQLLKQYGFDGLDLDWEYPADRGSPPEDRHRFTLLTQQLSEKYKKEGLLLSAATPAAPSKYDSCYEPEVCKYLDFVNIMAYDYSGPWDNVAGHNSALTSQKQTVEHMIKKPDCTPDKLNLGMGAYGRTHKLANPSNNHIGAPTLGGGAAAGPYTGESGFLSYYEVCEKLKQGWKKEWSNEHKVPYAHSGSSWVGYDDTDSITEKAEYVNQMELGGAMFWAMDLDDFRGDKCDEGKFPLINAAKEVVNGKGPSTKPSVTRTTLATTTTSKPIDQSPTAAMYCLESKEKQTYANVTNNCQTYYECLTAPNGKQITITRTCPSPLIFSEDKNKCIKEKDITDSHIKCSTQFGNPSGPISSANCWDPASVVSDSMCRFYTVCSSKHRYECPPESLFSSSLKRCVPKKHVQCWW